MIDQYIKTIENIFSYNNEYLNIQDFFMVILLIILIILLVLTIEFIIIGIFLNKFNKILYGKGTIIAFIPVAQTYLLGKLSFNKLVGIILAIGSIIPYLNIMNNYDYIVSIGEWIKIAKIGIFIYALIKYNKIKKGIISKEAALFQSDQFGFNPINEVIPGVNQTVSNKAFVQAQNNIPHYCRNCGSTLIPNSSFCQQCGQPIKK